MRSRHLFSSSVFALLAAAPALALSGCESRGGPDTASRLARARGLVGEGRPRDALAPLDAALARDPRSVAVRRLKARVLLSLGRSRQALPLLRSLAGEIEDTEIEVSLGEALLVVGDAPGSRAVFQALLERRDVPPPFAQRARLGAAAALNREKRYAEARDLLVGPLLGRRQSERRLHHLAVALRGLGRPAAARAFERRALELQPYFHELRERQSAVAARDPVKAAFHEARAHFELGRLGDALDAVDRGLGREPGQVDLHLLGCELTLALGRLRQAIPRYRKLVQESRSHRIGLALARLLIRAGAAREARKIIAATADTEGMPRENRTIQAQRGRALLELGDLPAVVELFKSVDRPHTEEPGEGRPPSETISLVKAELFIYTGKNDVARQLLTQEFRELAGGQGWAAALLLMAREPEPAAGEELPDLSSLVDHPGFVGRCLELPSVTLGVHQRNLLRDAQRIVEERRGIFQRMGSRSDGDAEVFPLWEELHALYLRGGARRKALELAWYLWRKNRRGPRENLLVARSLSRREETLQRLEAVGRVPSDEAQSETGVLGREARTYLGLEP
ncbi:MAG: tetratricopeptide repeat protein [Planctomycetota bacterium]|nr:tetratricopeptide repeat protein [Planctomycetota bacterium]